VVLGDIEVTPPTICKAAFKALLGVANVNHVAQTTVGPVYCTVPSAVTVVNALAVSEPMCRGTVALEILAKVAGLHTGHSFLVEVGLEEFIDVWVAVVRHTET